MEVTPDRGLSSLSHCGGSPGLGGSLREDPREGAKAVHPKPDEERRQGCQRLVASAREEGEHPLLGRKPRTGANATRRSGARVRVCTLSPGHAAGPKARCFRAGRKPCGPNRELASTGTRSRVFEKQTSDEHIFHRDLPRGALQGVTRARFLALGKPLPGCFPDDRGRWRRSEEGVPAFRGVPNRFTREGRTRGLRGLRGSRLGNELNHGVRRLGFHAPWP